MYPPVGVGQIRTSHRHDLQLAGGRIRVPRGTMLWVPHHSTPPRLLPIISTCLARDLAGCKLLQMLCPTATSCACRTRACPIVTLGVLSKRTGSAPRMLCKESS